MITLMTTMMINCSLIRAPLTFTITKNEYPHAKKFGLWESPPILCDLFRLWLQKWKSLIIHCGFNFRFYNMTMHPQRGLGMGDSGHGRRLDYICSSPRLGQRCTINHQQSNRRILRGLRVVPSNVSLSTAWSWAQACALQCSSVHLGGTLTLHSILILNGYGVAIWNTRTYVAYRQIANPASFSHRIE